MKTISNKHLLAALCASCAALLTPALLAACQGDDDQYSLEYFYDKYADDSGDDGDDDTPSVIVGDTLAITIEWNGTTATLSGPTDSVSVAQDGADITISSTVTRYLELTLSGTTTDGSLLVYSDRAWGLVLDGVTLTNADGPAINNQCSKWLYITLADGTTSTLTDGTTYADAPVNAAGKAIDQKGTLFSEGQIMLKGTGTLVVNGNAKNGIASDDYIVLSEGTVSVNMATTATNGVKVNDGITISGGTLDISVAAPGARGIRSGSYTTIDGGTTTISTSGDCKIEVADGVRDTTTAAGIKSDSLFTMTAGQLTIRSTGDGGKGINCSQDIVFSGGQLSVTTTGKNKQGKPKGVKSDTEIIVLGGTFESTVSKSKACDSGGEEVPTIQGTPAEQTLETRHIYIRFDQ